MQYSVSSFAAIQNLEASQTFERLIKETAATKTLQALRGLKVFIKK